jgi:diguanylate cyclase (GGDEF)-like protein
MPVAMLEGCNRFLTAHVLRVARLPRMGENGLKRWGEIPLPTSVRGRIIAGFGLLVFILAAVVGDSAWLIREHRSRLAEMELDSNTVSHLQQTQFEGSAAAVNLSHYVLTGDESLIPKVRERLRAATDDLAEAIASERAEGNEEGVAELQQLAITTASVPGVVEEIITIRRSGDIEGATERLSEFMDFQRLEGPFEGAANEERQGLAATRESATRVGDLAFWLLVISGAAGVALGVLVSALIARSILRPLSQLESTALAVADGHLEARAPTTGPREFVRLGASLNQMTEELLDVSKRRELEETIRRQSYYDALTDLPNRALFKDRLALALTEARRSKQMLAVMFLDLDQFKLVNDTASRAQGDLLLKIVAEQLKSLVREGDFLARVGGDEFTALLDIAGIEDAVAVAERILKSFQETRALGGHEFRVTASIGITVYPGDGGNAETLLRNADIAMHRAKEEGKNTYAIYTPAMNTQIAERVALERDLRRALEREEFVVYYQPQVEIEGGQIVGMEALVRWQHPERGLVAPTEFISVAEETGLIVPVGEWVLRVTCIENRAWQEADLPQLRAAVNLSARQFQRRDIVETVTRVLEETGLGPQWLQLEITEGTVIEDVDFAIKTLRELKEMGIQIAIDDFGTGHSALSYLRLFPIDVVKIDRSFVRDLTLDPDDAAIATSIIAMAHSLKLEVIAEGVETEEQLAFLQRERCDQMQGYLFSKPVPSEEFETMLRQAKRLPVPILSAR